MQAIAEPARPGRALPRPALGSRRALLFGCVVVAALSLLITHDPTYDPYSWLVWGREITHFDLVTTSGPSWKPLPVLFTTPFSLFGDTAAPLLWLVVARVGGFFSWVLGYRLAARVAGPVAGVIAVVGMVCANEVAFNWLRGDSEGVLVALFLGAIDRHLDGKPRQALLLGIAAGLARPEVWPFLVLYGLWMLYDDRERRLQTFVLLAAGALLTGVLWLVPEYIGSGDWFRAASRALQPVADSPALAKHPFLDVFPHSASAIAAPLYAGAVVATLVGAQIWRRERRVDLRLSLAAVATVLMLEVATLAQIGFTGNLRYVTLPASLVCVLGGIGWVDLARMRRRVPIYIAVVVSVAGLASAAPTLAKVHTQYKELRMGNGFYTQALPELIKAAGGEQRLKSCGPLYSGAFQTQALAWFLHVHVDTVTIFPKPPGTVIFPRPTLWGSSPKFPNVKLTPRWLAASSVCRF